MYRSGPRPPRPITMQSCPCMMAPQLMTLLLPGPDTSPQHYPDLTEEDMRGIQRCFFEPSTASSSHTNTFRS